MRPGCLTLNDLATLYPRLAPVLPRLLNRAVAAPIAIREEACQLAWGQLVSHRDEVDREHALGWLATTARREAVRLLREREAYEPLDAQTLFSPEESQPTALAESRQRLAELASLPERQQRIIWLRGAGYASTEIASRTGDTLRTVERQLALARRALRELEAA
jgi:RNA polymerase sigma factor (sigma-70 family)